MTEAQASILDHIIMFTTGARSLSAGEGYSKVARKLTVKVYCIVAQVIVEFNVAFHETYSIDQTSN